MKASWRERLGRVIRFVLSGVANTGLSWMIYLALKNWMHYPTCLRRSLRIRHLDLILLECSLGIQGRALLARRFFLSLDLSCSICFIGAPVVRFDRGLSAEPSLGAT